MWKEIFKLMSSFPKYTAIYNHDMVGTYMDTIPNKIVFY